MKKPDEFRVERSAVFKADAATLFEQLNDLQKGQDWSPWVEMDPDAGYSFEGPDAGEGATVHWDGKKSGKGTMTIVKSVPNELVLSSLQFYKPMVATNTAEFKLEAENDNTKLTWSMYGPNKFMGKVMSVFMDCEKMCGDQFEKGFENLKKVVEK